MKSFILILFCILTVNAKSLLYQLQNLDVNQALNTKFDYIVTDFSKDGTLDGAYLYDEIKSLKDSNKTVLSYFSIGEAEDYRFYFDLAWIDEAKNPTNDAPTWLGHTNSNWPGNYKVRYWDDNWFEVIKPYLDRIIKAGFDGVYLDIVDAYEYWADRDNYIDYGGNERLLSTDPIDDENLSANRMIDFIKKIKDYAKAKNPKFLIFPQNGSFIINYDYRGIYYDIVDGLGIESLFYNELDLKTDISQRLNILRGYKEHNKTILVTDYIDDGSGFVGDNKKRVNDFYKRTLKEDFVPYCADKSRSLDNINSISKSLASHSKTFTTDFLQNFSVGIGSSEGIDFKSKDGDKIWMDATDLMRDSELNNSYLNEIKDYNVTKFYDIQNKLKNANFLVLWLTKGWSESWFNKTKLQKLLDENKTIIFNYWYFGDDIGGSDGYEVFLNEKEDYLADALRVKNFLADLNGTKAVVMEPEFNKVWMDEDSQKAKEFAGVIKSAIKIIKQSNALVSISPMDRGARNFDTAYSGYKRDSLGDKVEWAKAFGVLDYVVDDIDFITIQEMISQFTKDSSKFPQSKLVSYTKSELGLSDFVSRVENYARFYNQKYHLPVLLGYIGFPEGGWVDKNKDNLFDEDEFVPNMWTKELVRLYYRLKLSNKELQDSGLIGYAPMALFDDPDHDLPGYQFFSENEYHIGLLATDAKNGIIDEPRGTKIEFKGIGDVSILDILYTKENYLFLDEGWNLVGLKDSDFSKFKIIWQWDDGWSVYLKDLNATNYGIKELKNISLDKGYWVYSEDTMLFDYDKNVSSCDSQNNNWRLCSHLNKLPNAHIVWKYSNNRWYAYSNNTETFNQLKSNFDTINSISVQDGVWIK
jgi:cysteinyl-tRNA synthetase